MEKTKELLRWGLVLLVFSVIIAYFFGVFDSKEHTYKPCAGMSGDMYKTCADFYIYERGWTWDEVKNGILVPNP